MQNNEVGYCYPAHSDVIAMVAKRLRGLAPNGHLQHDQRAVQTGDVFIALRGAKVNGVDFAKQAIAQGAVAVVHDCDNPLEQVPVPSFAMNHLAEHLGQLAAEFYRHPSQQLRVMAVTGTNGKTSVSHFVAQLLALQGLPCGVMGTLGVGVYGQLVDSANTTPLATTIQQQFASWRDQACQHVAMEVSSHGLSLGRVSYSQFAVKIFTNLSHDHLDFHGSMTQYALAKRALFVDYPQGINILNQDDETAQQWLAESALQDSWVYGQKPLALGQYGAQIQGLTLTEQGVQFELHSHLGTVSVQAPVFGVFNVYNVTAALLAMVALGYDLKHVARDCAKLQTVPGRMERFSVAGKATVVVDYAHTPDALQLALQSLRAHNPRALWCVFGCGGDRDSAKRPVMGKIAAELADYVVLTNDNPRTEQPQQILADIAKGLDGRAFVTEPDRVTAIRYAVANAQPGDLILVAGKGHETYQIIGHEKRDYDERAWVTQILEEQV